MKTGQGQSNSSHSERKIPFEWQGLMMVVPTTVNGHTVRLVLDSGTDGNIIIFKSAYRRLGLGKVRSTLRSYGRSEPETARIFRTKTLEISKGTVLRGVPVSVVGWSILGFDGVLPLRMLGSHSIELDFDGACVVVRSITKIHGHESTSDLPYLSLPFQTKFGHPVFQLAAGGRTLTMLADTGSAITEFAPDAVSSSDLTLCKNYVLPDFSKSIGNSGNIAMDGDRYRTCLSAKPGIHKFRIDASPSPILVLENGAITVSSEHWEKFLTGKDNRRGADGIVGMPFWLQFRKMIFDFDTNRIVVAGDRYGNLARFPVGGTVLHPGLQSAITVDNGAILDMTLGFGEYLAENLAKGDQVAARPVLSGANLWSRSWNIGRLKVVGGTPVKLLYPQGPYDIQKEDRILSYPIGTLAIWRCLPANAAATSVDSPKVTLSSPSSNTPGGKNLSAINNIPDGVQQTLSISDALTAGNIFVPGVAGNQILSVVDPSNGVPYLIACGPEEKIRVIAAELAKAFKEAANEKPEVDGVTKSPGNAN